MDLRRLLLLLMLAAAGPVSAHEGIPFDATSPDDPVDVQRIAPGGSGTYRLTVRSLAGTAGTAFMHAYLESREVALAQYLFTSAEPRCGSPELEPMPYVPRLFFPVGPLQPGETLACNYTVQRLAGSIDDLGFRRMNPCYDCVTRRGTLPDSSFRVLPGGVDERGMLMRLVLSNRGDTAIARRSVTTECGEFGGGFFDPRPFVIESGFPGSCPVAEYGAGCANFTGQSFGSFAFDLGPAPVGGESSCLVRVVSTGGQGRRTADMSFREDRAILANGAVVFDVDAGNDTDGIGTGNLSFATIPVPWTALLAIGLAIALTGLALLRRD